MTVSSRHRVLLEAVPQVTSARALMLAGTMSAQSKTATWHDRAKWLSGLTNLVGPEGFEPSTNGLRDPLAPLRAL